MTLSGREYSEEFKRQVEEVLRPPKPLPKSPKVETEIIREQVIMPPSGLEQRIIDLESRFDDLQRDVYELKKSKK